MYIRHQALSVCRCCRATRAPKVSRCVTGAMVQRSVGQCRLQEATGVLKTLWCATSTVVPMSARHYKSGAQQSQFLLALLRPKPQLWFRVQFLFFQIQFFYFANCLLHLQESSIKNCKETYLLQCFYILESFTLVLTKMNTLCS